MRILLLALSLAACTPLEGETGPSGPAGPQGPQGPAGSSSSSGAGRLVWKDSTGSVVGRDATVYQDAQGWVWYLDSETARPNTSHGTAGVWYTGASCSGTAYVSAFVPRAPFKVPGQAAFRVRPDTLAAETPTLVSARDALGNCSASSLVGLRMIRLDQTTPAQAIAEPSWSFVAPLRLEREP